MELNTRFEVLTAVVMENIIFCNITQCSPLKANRCFRGTCHFLLQGQKSAEQETSVQADVSACHMLSHWFLARLILRH
jgi:hypothetical protein